MPVTNATPMRAVRNGSSPYVSCPRPQRGSRKMLMFGAQNVRRKKISCWPTRLAWGYLARARPRVMLRAALGRDGLADVMDQRGVPRGREADHLWKRRRVAGGRDAV